MNDEFDYDALRQSLARSHRWSQVRWWILFAIGTTGIIGVMIVLNDILNSVVARMCR